MGTAGQAAGQSSVWQARVVSGLVTDPHMALDTCLGDGPPTS